MKLLAGLTPMLLLFAVAGCRTTSDSARRPEPLPDLKGVAIGNLTGDGQTYMGGSPDAKDLPAVRAAGVTTLVDLRLAEQVPAGFREQALAAGLAYEHIPMRSDAMTGDQAQALLSGLKAHAGEPILIHCASGNRAGAMYGVYRRAQGCSVTESLALADAAGLKHPDLRRDLSQVLEQMATAP